jgi:hypothetical protein
MLLIMILLSITLSTANATDDFSTIVDQAKKAYEEGNYGIVIDYLNKMTEIVKSKIGNSDNNELEKVQTWKKIKSWNGNGIKNTESFIIKSDEWRIIWTNKGRLLQISVQLKEESDFSIFGYAANTGEPGSDISYFHKSGEYYLHISSIGGWSVIVEEKIDGESLSRNVDDLANTSTEESIEKTINSFGAENHNEIYYTIEEIEDISFSGCERLKVTLRTNRRLTETEVRALAEIIVNQIIADDNVNAIVIFMYDTEHTTGQYTLASVIWAPYGEWVKAKDAKTGDYSKHIYKIEMAPERPPEPKMVGGLPVEKAKEYFKEIVAAEDRAWDDLVVKYPDGVTEEAIDYLRTLEDEYKEKVYEKYGVTEEQDTEITITAIQQMWPLE